MPVVSARLVMLLCGALVALAGVSGCANFSHRKHGPNCHCGCSHSSAELETGPEMSAAPEETAICPHGIRGGCLHCRHRQHGAGHLGREERPFVPPLARFHPVPTRPVFEPRGEE